MGNLNSKQSDTEINATAMLVRAHIQKKSELLSQIGEYRIKSNYYKSNTKFKELKEIDKTGKVSMHRLSENREKASSYRNSPKKNPSFITFREFSEKSRHLSLTPNELKTLNSDIEASEQKKKILNEKLDYLLRILRAKREIHAENEEKIEKLSKKSSDFGESGTFTLPILRCHTSSFNTLSIPEVSHCKSASTTTRFNVSPPKLLEKISTFKKIPEKAAFLLSKQILRSEIQKNVDFAEKELNLSFEKTEKKFQRYKAIGMDSLMAKDFNEKTVEDLKKKIGYLEKELQDVEEERHFISYITSVGFKFSEFETREMEMRDRKMLLIDDLTEDVNSSVNESK